MARARLLVSLVFLIVKMKTTFSQSLDSQIRDELDPSRPQCPCFDRDDLFTTTGMIIQNKIQLLPSACDDDKENVYSLTYEYIDQLDHGTDAESTPPPPRPPGNPQLGGYLVEILPQLDGGTCILYPPTQPLPTVPHSMEKIMACGDLITTECANIRNSICPCFDMNDMVKLADRLTNDKNFVMDLEKSCQRNPGDDNSLPYGIYEKKIEQSTLHLGVDMKKSKDSTHKCHVGPDQDYPDLLPNQLIHCTNLIGSLCSTLKPKPNDSIHCMDEPNYAKDGITSKSCAQLTKDVGSSLSKKNCKSFDKSTNKHVFQHCRGSCQSCTCRNDDTYFFNGQPGKDCKWVAKNKEYCGKDADVSKYCPVACDSKCCKDNDNFKFKYKDKQKNCVFLMALTWKNPSKRNNLCRESRIAWNCPMSCLKCVKQPR